MEPTELPLVGLAFLPKKLPRVLTPELLALGRAAGLQLLGLDPYTPIEQQLQQAQQRRQEEQGLDGPVPSGAPAGNSGGVDGGVRLDVLLHKLHRDDVWEAHLECYAAAHPHLRILDAPNSIHATEDRGSMLDAIPPGGLRLEVKLQTQRQLTDALPPPALAAAEAAGARGEGAGAAAAAVAEAEAESMAEGQRVVVVSVRSPAQMVVSSLEELRAMIAGSASPQALVPPLLLKTQRSYAGGGGGHGIAVASSWAQLEGQAAAMQRAAASGEEADGGGTGGGVSSSTVDANGAGASVGWEPLVIQQYVPHSEALYKVYVLGKHVEVARRASLTADQLRQQKQQQGQQSGPSGSIGAGGGEGGTGGEGSSGLLANRISEAPLAAPSSSAAGDRGREQGVDAGDGAAQLPPGLDERVLHALAGALGDRLGLTMFNFDVVFPSDQGAAEEEEKRGDEEEEEEGEGKKAQGEQAGQGTEEPAHKRARLCGVTAEAGVVRGQPKEVRLFVVDVNYFPGYDKLQGWEALLVEHLRAAAEGAVAARRAAA